MRATEVLECASSSDGTYLFFGAPTGLCRVSVETGEVVEQRVDLPGMLPSNPSSTWWLVGEAAGGRLLYEALPTTGTEQHLVFGLAHGPKWTVKLADPVTGAFVTVIPYVWGPVSYGR